MRFLSVDARRESPSAGAILLAAALTLGAAGAIANPILSLRRRLFTGPSGADRTQHVVLAYTVPARATAARSDSGGSRRPSGATRRERMTSDSARAGLQGSNPDTAVASPVHMDSGSAVAMPVPRDAASSARKAGPVESRAGISRRTELTAAERDSVLAQLSSSVPTLARTRPPRQEEVDERLRERARLEAAARSEHRPVAISLGSGGIPLPFLGGPSRKQRVRDSIVNADNLLRIGRLVERARRDSIRRAEAARSVSRPGPADRPKAPI